MSNLQSNMDNPEKMAIHNTQDQEKQNICTTQYIFDTAMCKQVQIT